MTQLGWYVESATLMRTNNTEWRASAVDVGGAEFQVMPLFVLGVGWAFPPAWGQGEDVDSNADVSLMFSLEHAPSFASNERELAALSEALAAIMILDTAELRRRQRPRDMTIRPDTNAPSPQKQRTARIGML